MGITVGMEPDTLQEILRLTDERKKSPAVAKAASDYVRRRKAEELGHLLREGAFDYPMTNDAIEAMEATEHGAR